MSKQKNYLTERDVLSQIRHTSLSGNKTNCFYAYESETDRHINKKFLVYRKLRKAGYNVLCEPIFKSGIRMDILAWKEGNFINYEILETEDMKKFLSKIKTYPPEITVIPIKTDQDIEDLELI